MQPKLPYGAQPIWDMRIGGSKPIEPVFVSAVGELLDGNYQVLIRPGEKFEDLNWRWVVDLCVCLVYNEQSDRRYLSRLAKHILRFTPNGGYTTFDPSFGYLFMWNTDKQNGAIASYWKGYTGIPLLKIPNEPESIKVSTMSRFDRVAFDGVMPA